MSTERSRLNYAFFMVFPVVLSTETRNRMHHIYRLERSHLAHTTTCNTAHTSQPSATSTYSVVWWWFRHHRAAVRIFAARHTAILDDERWQQGISVVSLFFLSQLCNASHFRNRTKVKGAAAAVAKLKQREVEVVREKLIIFREVSLFSTLVCKRWKFTAVELVGKNTTTCRWQWN